MIASATTMTATSVPWYSSQFCHPIATIPWSRPKALAGARNGACGNRGQIPPLFATPAATVAAASSTSASSPNRYSSPSPRGPASRVKPLVNEIPR
jgi:hypothetical protein